MSYCKDLICFIKKLMSHHWDYREKIPSKREKLKLIKDTIKDYLTSETHEQHDITNYVQSITYYMIF